MSSKLYFDFCDKILPPEVAAPRYIHHNPLGAEDENRENRYKFTLQRYKDIFGVDPPALYWEGKAEDQEDSDDEEVEKEGGRKLVRLDEPSSSSSSSSSAAAPARTSSSAAARTYGAILTAKAAFDEYGTGHHSGYMSSHSTTVVSAKEYTTHETGIPADRVEETSAAVRDGRVLQEKDTLHTHMSMSGVGASAGAGVGAGAGTMMVAFCGTNDQNKRTKTTKHGNGNPTLITSLDFRSVSKINQSQP